MVVYNCFSNIEFSKLSLEQKYYFLRDNSKYRLFPAKKININFYNEQCKYLYSIKYMIINHICWVYYINNESINFTVVVNDNNINVNALLISKRSFIIYTDHYMLNNSSFQQDNNFYLYNQYYHHNGKISIKEWKNNKYKDFLYSLFLLKKL